MLNLFLKNFQPPAWLVAEAQQKALLLVNHVLMQEPEALARIARNQGRSVCVMWRNFSVPLVATPAGLFEWVEAPLTLGRAPDLTLTLLEELPLNLLQTALAGEKPQVRIEGDIQWAAELNWLVDHVRWDLEEDLSRLVGDAPAHLLVSGARQLTQALSAFVARRQP
jgi:ubiquinone biosynthesis protein UbiJ